MKSNRKNINKVISKALNETLEEKVSDLESKLKKNVNELGGMDDNHPDFGDLNFSKMSKKDMDRLIKKKFRDSDEDEDEDEKKYFLKKGDDEELDEGWDSEEMADFTEYEDYNPKKYKKIPLGKNMTDYSEIGDTQSGITPERHLSKELANFIEMLKRKKRDMGGEDDDLFGEFTEGKGETCEQCGSGSVNEGECSECGYKMEGIYDVDDIDSENEFDYTEEDVVMEDDVDMENDIKSRIDKFCNADSPDYNEQSCKFHKETFGGEMTEALRGNQKKLDKNKNGRLDSTDFKMLRAMKGKKRETDEEVEEGNAFTGALAKAKKRGDDEFEVDGKTYDVKESVKLTESQLVDLIESVIVEQKLKSTGTPRGLQKYKQSHEKSGKENKDNLKNVSKKMKDYLKDGSKGSFEMNPKHFPKGNGELAKMSKKAYVPSDAIKDYTDNLTAAGLENLDYDEIHPNEDWISKNVEGSSMTGNNPEWANAVDTGINKKRNKIRKDNMLAKIKRKAYNKAPQPIISDKSGEDSGDKLMMKLESKTEKDKNKLNEEFDRMKNLIGYDRKTQ